MFSRYFKPLKAHPTSMASHTITMNKLLSFLAFFLHISTSLLSTAYAFSPTDHYLINCGSRAAATLDFDRRVFTGDDSRFLASTRTIQLENAGSNLDSSSPLYRTARAFNRPARYSFPIRDPGTHHLVRLHFHPVHNRCYNNLFEAEFHVVANGYLLLRNFRIPKNIDFPMIKEFLIPVHDEKLEITFLPSAKSRYGFVNAIEVISAPKDLIADVVAYDNSERNESINGTSNNGFETVHRVNIGGFKVTPFNDSLWRTWVTDDEYFKSSSNSQNVEQIHFGGRINYQTGGASREVGPDNVYNTARVIKSSNSSIPNTNMTFVFEVEKGYNYLVRLHFCDIASVAAGMLYFNVYMNGDLVYENLDLTYVTNRLLASPFYADMLVDGHDSDALVLSVGPSNMSLPRAVDAILNGVEIWKTNNSRGSFDGEVCAEFLWRVWRKEHVSVFVPLVAVVFLLLSAAMFMQRRRGGYVGWSRLPVDVSEDNLKIGDQFASTKA